MLDLHSPPPVLTLEEMELAISAVAFPVATILMLLIVANFACSCNRLPGVATATLCSMLVAVAMGTWARHQASETVIESTLRKVITDYSSLLYNGSLMVMSVQAMLLTGNKPRDNIFRRNAFYWNLLALLVPIMIASILGASQYFFDSLVTDENALIFASPFFLLAVVQVIAQICIGFYGKRVIKEASERITMTAYMVPVDGTNGCRAVNKMKAYNGLIRNVFYVITISTWANLAAQVLIGVLSFGDNASLVSFVRTSAYLANYLICSIATFAALRKLPARYGHN